LAFVFFESKGKVHGCDVAFAQVKIYALFSFTLYKKIRKKETLDT
jgi:hypothetical protein